MVLWEMTLATAYVLGLKRTYRLALRLQRRIISPRRPRLREFVYRRTRTVFDIALSVHRNIQKQDIQMGRSIGNWILRWLDHIKPSANIRGDPPAKIPAHEIRTTTKPAGSSPCAGINSTDGQHSSAGRDSDRSLFAVSMPMSRTNSSHLASASEDRNNERLVRLNSGCGIRSLPSTTLGLWYQPVRQNVRAIGSCKNIPFAAPLAPRFNSKGISGGVIREDIAAWMKQ